jgi:hypothetical protein
MGLYTLFNGLTHVVSPFFDRVILGGASPENLVPVVRRSGSSA